MIIHKYIGAWALCPYVQNYVLHKASSGYGERDEEESEDVPISGRFTDPCPEFSGSYPELALASVSEELTSPKGEPAYHQPPSCKELLSCETALLN